jgi:hypothetical protein
MRRCQFLPDLFFDLFFASILVGREACSTVEERHSTILSYTVVIEQQRFIKAFLQGLRLLALNLE